MPANRIPNFVALLASVLLLSGCMGYRLGSMLPPDIDSVHVPIVKNATEEPLLSDEVTQAVLAEIQQDGSLSIEQQDSADTLLYVTITRYDLQPLAFEDSNRARPNEYRLILEATVEMVRRESGEVVVRSGTLQGRSTFQLAGDLTAGKRLGLPEASRDLSRKIVSAVTEAWPD